MHLVIGKDSVIRAQGEKLEARRRRRWPASSARTASTTQTGLIVVRHADPAQNGRRPGRLPHHCSARRTATRSSPRPGRCSKKRASKLPPPKDAEISEACSDGACMIIDWGDKVRGAAVISSYAAPLLEGCGTIKKGDLRVVGETEPVPFITAFATNLLSEDEQAEVQRVLYDAGKEPGMLLALETLAGLRARWTYKFLEPKIRTATSTDAKPKPATQRTKRSRADDATTNHPVLARVAGADAERPRRLAAA